MTVNGRVVSPPHLSMLLMQNNKTGLFLTYSRGCDLQTNPHTVPKRSCGLHTRRTSHLALCIFRRVYDIIIFKFLLEYNRPTTGKKMGTGCAGKKGEEYITRMMMKVRCVNLITRLWWRMLCLYIGAHAKIPSHSFFPVILTLCRIIFFFATYVQFSCFLMSNRQFESKAN